jgi:hypothetical protein
MDSKLPDRFSGAEKVKVLDPSPTPKGITELELIPVFYDLDVYKKKPTAL